MKFFSSVVLLAIGLCLAIEPAIAQRSQRVQSAAGRQKPPIIDMHIHAFGFDEYGTPPPPNGVTGKRPTARSDKEAMEATFAAMKRYNIVKAVASGPLDDVLRWREAAPDRIIGGAYAG